MGQAIQGPPPSNQGQQLNLPHQANLGQPGINQGQPPNAPIQAPQQAKFRLGISKKVQEECSMPGSIWDKLNKLTTKIKDSATKHLPTCTRTPIATIPTKPSTMAPTV